jgi:exosortase family protein XrtF
MISLFKEFKPTIIFLIKFIGLYIIGNLLYGFYITYFEPRPDPVTHCVSRQVSALLTASGYETQIEDSNTKPTTFIIYQTKNILSVYEGCNGLNTMIVFLAFMVSFGPLQKKMFWFIPLGLLIIHIANLARVSMLFFVSAFLPHLMYFTHKYLFTAALYIIIFLLWIWWVKAFQENE